MKFYKYLLKKIIHKTNISYFYKNHNLNLSLIFPTHENR
jgi:hypothetical protein